MKVTIIKGPRFEKTKENWNKKITKAISSKMKETLVIEENNQAVS